MLSESCSEGDSNNFQDYGEWEDHNSIDYHMFVKLHHVAHQRFYCLAEQYPIPKMIVTYTTSYLMTRALLFVISWVSLGTLTLLKAFPLKSRHEPVEYEYVPMNVTSCEDLSLKYKQLWKKSSQCVKRAANQCQFSA